MDKVQIVTQEYMAITSNQCLNMMLYLINHRAINKDLQKWALLSNPPRRPHPEDLSLNNRDSPTNSSEQHYRWW